MRFSSAQLQSGRVDKRAIAEVWKEMAQRDASSFWRSIAPIWPSKRALTARSSGLDGGQIAGIAVGAIVGSFFILVVAGFLYFRHRRMQHRAQDDLLPTKEPSSSRRVSFPQPEVPTSQSESSQREPQRSVKDDVTDRNAVSGFGTANDFQQSPTTGAPTLDTEFYPHVQAGQAGLPEEYDLSSPRRISEPFPEAQNQTTSPLEYEASPVGGNADYYDANVAMDSDPEQATMAPPSRQLTDAYQEQLRMSREKRKGSKSSALSRVFRNFKRKRSSRTSNLASEQTNDPGSPSFRQPDVPLNSVEGHEQPQRPWTAGIDPSAQSDSFYAEPQEMSEGTRTTQHQSKKSKLRGPSGDTAGLAPHRVDSLRTALNTEPTPDPQLPSSAFGRGTQSPSSLYGPQAVQFSARDQYRLNSPDIPSPMTVGAPAMPDDVNTSALRSSNSPPLLPESFVDPMAIMRPTTDTEKAAYHQTAWDRWNSTSPPVDATSSAPGSPPSGLGLNQGDDLDEEMNEAGEDDEDDDAEYDESEDEDDINMDAPEIPSITVPDVDLNHIPYDGPSDYSTPPGQSSTNPSSGRTPDTRITASPSPHTIDFIKPEVSTSPEALSAVSPEKSALTCEMCGRSFDQIHKLNHHKRYHDRKHACTYAGCDKRFGTKTHLDRHINDKHEKKKGFHCTEPNCPYFFGGKAFPRKDNWRRHMQNKHGVNPPNGPEPIAGYM